MPRPGSSNPTALSGAGRVNLPSRLIQLLSPIGPIQNPIEMGETHENGASKPWKLKGSQQQFRTVFGTEVN